MSACCFASGSRRSRSRCRVRPVQGDDAIRIGVDGRGGGHGRARFDDRHPSEREDRHGHEQRRELAIVERRDDQADDQRRRRGSPAAPAPPAGPRARGLAPGTTATGSRRRTPPTSCSSRACPQRDQPGGRALRSCAGGSGTRGFRRPACGSDDRARRPLALLGAGRHPRLGLGLRWRGHGSGIGTRQPSSAVPSAKFPAGACRGHGGSMVGLARPHEELWSP